MAQQEVSRKGKIPEATINRLSVYGRVLNQFEEEGVEVVSSAALAARCGLNPAQIRKDLAYFGEFGVRGVGYYVKDLKEDLKRVLGVTKIWKVALVGAGNLGSALLAYKGFLAHGFTIDAVFDKYPEKKRHLKRLGCPKVLSMNDLGRVVKSKAIKIGIVAVPSDGAQSVVNRLVDAGISGILNFAPIRVSVPPHVKVKNVDLGSELEGLAFFLSKETEG
ncbi:MAG: redox-sensing transcriptional repressor Rex [Nitrospinota bacterium]